MGNIYLCHTLYHVLIALVRALRERPMASRLVLSESIPDAAALRQRLLDGCPGLWEDITVVNEETLDAQNAESVFFRLRHPGRKPYFSLPKEGRV